MKPQLLTIFQDLRHALLILLLAPFFLLQIIAPGTMAQAGPDGVQMVLCFDSAIIENAVPANAMPADGTHKADVACEWAGVVGGVSIVPERGQVAAFPAETAASYTIVPKQLIHIQSNRWDPARGPPLAV